MNSQIKPWKERMDTDDHIVINCARKQGDIIAHDAEIADLRATIVRYEAQMLRMAQCAGEFAKDAAPVSQQAAGDARQRQILHDLTIAAVERWVAAELKNAKNFGAGGPSERNDMFIIGADFLDRLHAALIAPVSVSMQNIEDIQQYGAAGAYYNGSPEQRAKIDAAIAKADGVMMIARESRDRRKADMPYEAEGFDRRKADRRDKPRHED